MEDKAGKEYWGATYEGKPSKDVFNPHTHQIRHFWKQQFHNYFLRVFAKTKKKAGTLLEIGCGDSRMLGYFAREFAFEVNGIDYSEAGCCSARSNLEEEAVEGNVVCADLFAPPVFLLERFDIVVSFGVAEHFADTSECITAISRFLKPNGLIITSVPNMSGMIGKVQGWLDRRVLDRHVALNKEDLQSAHERAGLRVLSCEYFLFVNLATANINDTRTGTVQHLSKTLFMKVLRGITGCIWTLEVVMGPLKSNRVTSPYLLCAARKGSARTELPVKE